MACDSDSTMASSVTNDITTEKETKFLRENFDAVEFSGGYCFATYTGNADSLYDVLDRYLSLNSTSFIRAETHVKEKNHKRYSQEGKPLRFNFVSGFICSRIRCSITVLIVLNCSSCSRNVLSFAARKICDRVNS